MENHKLFEQMLAVLKMNLSILPFGADYAISSNADGAGNYQTVKYYKGGATGDLIKIVTYTFDGSSKIVTTLVTPA